VGREDSLRGITVLDVRRDAGADGTVADGGLGDDA
jgi:hypothetical protein